MGQGCLVSVTHSSVTLADEGRARAKERTAMMVRTHVLVANIASPYVAQVSNLSGTGGVRLLAAVVGGAGDLCDLDHASASPARACFWPARMASYGVRRLAG